MGYRSNIRCLIYHNGQEDAEESYGKLKTIMHTTFKEVLEEWESDFNFRDARKIIDFECNDVKWYDSYQVVSDFMGMLESIGELGYAVEFIRVGEDNDDIERIEYGNPNWYLCTSTTIHAYF